MFSLLDESGKNWKMLEGLRHGINGNRVSGGSVCLAPCSIADLVVNFRNDMVCYSSLIELPFQLSLAVIFMLFHVDRAGGFIAGFWHVYYSMGFSRWWTAWMTMFRLGFLADAGLLLLGRV